MEPSQTNPKKIYLGNLPFSISQDGLEELCTPFGKVEVNLITDYNTGRPKGFGFAEYETEEAAKAAIEALNETEVDGRTIFVKIARAKQPRNNRFSDRRGGGGGGYNRGGRGDRNDRRSYGRNDR